jgi:dienelactone hydrolase
MRSEVLTYQADGLSMQSHLYFEAGVSGKRPGVLVFPEAFGLGEHAKSRAQRLAALGYIALACDLHGGGEVLNDLPTVMGLLAPLRENPGRIRARSEGGLHALLARPEVDAAHIAAIGFCFGGTMALELARGGAEIAGAVGFHSGLATAAPQDAHQIKGKILVCLGADDPGIDAAQRSAFEDEMRAGKVDWQMNLYGGVVHSFTNPAADAMGMPEMARYDPQADARSWAEMRAFFAEIFAPKG